MYSVRTAVARALRTAATQRGAAACAVALTMGLAGAAYAQDQSAQNSASAGAQTLDEVTVTGSRIKRSTDFDTANPTTVVDSSYLQNLGIVNVGAAIAQLPSNISNNTPTTTGNANFFTGSTIANLRGLNPFFGSRTLTLVNNRRFVPTNQGDGVDLNFIPSVMINRVDVVTGGASAAYGSGAISGVQNIFLNTKLEGGKADIDYQQSTGDSDAKDKHLGLAFGHGFADGRGHFVLGGEYEKLDAVGCVDARDFCAKNQGFYTNLGPGPLFLKGSNLHANDISNNGVLTGLAGPSATQAYQSNAAGTGVTPFNLGQGASPVNAFAPAGSPFTTVIGGDGNPIYQFTNLRAPVDRKVATGTLNFALTDSLNLSVDASWGQVETTNQNGALGSQFVFQSGANPFAAPVLAAAGSPIAFVNKNWDAQSDAFTTFTTKVKRGSVGLDGKFGSSTWSWDAYYQIGRTDRGQLVHDNLHNNATGLALNVVTGPSGAPICAVNAPGAPLPTGIDPALAAACVPVNMFGTAPLTQAQHDYIFGDLNEVLDYTQQVLAVNTSGELFDGFGAGPISAAVGYEHRDELGHNLENGAGIGPDLPAYIRTDYLIQYGEAFSGKVKVDEAYVEVSLPLLKDAPGAKKLDFDVSARESRYDNQGLAGTFAFDGTPRPSASHNLTTWKVSGIWDPIESFRVRGSQSRDARSANFRELYYGQKIGAGGLFGYCDPFLANSRANPCNWSLEGNTSLRPETADTTTVGFVVSPGGAATGLQFAVDYFKINIKQAIEQAQIQGVWQRCQLQNNPTDCALIQFDPTATFSERPNGAACTPGDPLAPDCVTFRSIANVRAQSFNGAHYTFKGIDFTGSWATDFGNGSNLSVRLLAEHMIDQIFQSSPTTAPINIVGQTGTANSFLSDNQPTAKWTGSLTGTYTRGAWGMTAQMRAFSGGIMDYNAPNGVTAAGLVRYDVTKVPSYQVFSLSSQYTFSELGGVNSLQVYGVIDNLFDKQPPFASGAGAFGLSNGNGGTNPTFYDALGRMARVGVRMTF